MDRNKNVIRCLISLSLSLSIQIERFPNEKQIFMISFISFFFFVYKQTPFLVPILQQTQSRIFFGLVVAYFGER